MAAGTARRTGDRPLGSGLLWRCGHGRTEAAADLADRLGVRASRPPGSQHLVGGVQLGQQPLGPGPVGASEAEEELPIDRHPGLPAPSVQCAMTGLSYHITTGP